MTSKTKNSLERDDQWLLFRLDEIWTRYFSDIPQTNKIFIKFGRFAKYRLGSIKLDKHTKASLITITSMFKDIKVPQEVIDHTIGHELVHYAHGFSSTNPRLFKYPHAGGVVKKEMGERGMGGLYNSYKKWVELYRKSFKAKYEW